jgi:hypothetical protein
VDPRQQLAQIMAALPRGGTPNVMLSGRQSPNVEVQPDAGQPITRTDIEHLSPGWNNFDFLHRVHGMNPTPVAEQALSTATPPKLPTNLRTMQDSASAYAQPFDSNPVPPDASRFDFNAPPGLNWGSVGATRPGLRLAPWNVDWSQ